jgi:hypothetical protein
MIEPVRKLGEDVRNFFQGIQEDIRLIGLEGTERELAQAEIERDRELKQVQNFYEQQKELASQGYTSLREARKQYEGQGLPSLRNTTRLFRKLPGVLG